MWGFFTETTDFPFGVEDMSTYIPPCPNPTSEWGMLG